MEREAEYGAWGPYGDAAFDDPYNLDRVAADRDYDFRLGAIGGLGDLGAFGAERMLEEERFGGPLAARDFERDRLFGDDMYARDRAIRDRDMAMDEGYGDWGYGEAAFEDRAAHDAEERLLEDRIALDRIEVDRAREYERWL